MTAIEFIKYHAPDAIYWIIAAGIFEASLMIWRWAIPRIVSFARSSWATLANLLRR